MVPKPLRHRRSAGKVPWSMGSELLSLTQPQLALAGGVGVHFIVDLEAGKPTLRLKNVLRVLHALSGRLSIDGLPSGA